MKHRAKFSFSFVFTVDAYILWKNWWKICTKSMKFYFYKRHEVKKSQIGWKLKTKKQFDVHRKFSFDVVLWRIKIYDVWKQFFDSENFYKASKERERIVLCPLKAGLIAAHWLTFCWMKAKLTFCFTWVALMDGGSLLLEKEEDERWAKH